MALTVTLPISSEEQAALEAQAAARGVSVDELLRKAVLEVISPNIQSRPVPMSIEQWEAELNDWLDNQPDMPSLSDEAISREQIYTREDEML